MDVLEAVFSLNFGYFIWLFSNNLHWLFIFATVMVFFQGREKHRIFYVTALILMFYGTVDMADMLEWHFPPILLFLIMLTNIVVVAFANYGVIDKYNGWIGIGAFWVFWIELSMFV